MNEIIKVNEMKLGEECIKTVNARELHEFLEVGKNFGNWIVDRINKFGFQENIDYISCLPKTVSGPDRGIAAHGGSNKKEYFISIDMAKELSMVERNEKGKEARQYFILCEKQLREKDTISQAALNDPETLRGLLLDYSEKVIKLENKVKEDAPKVELVDAIADSRKTWSIGEVANIISSREGRWTIGRNNLFEFLRIKKFIQKSKLRPYQKWIKNSLFILSPPKDKYDLNPQVRITGKGFTKLGKILVDTFDNNGFKGEITKRDLQSL